MIDSNNILNVRDLKVSFGEKAARKNVLNNVEIDLKRGEWLGLAGRSGSGKSVTAMAILGLLPTHNTHLSLELEINSSKSGKLTSADLLAIRRHVVSMIFQDPVNALNPVMTCGKQIEEVVRLYNKEEKDSKATVMQWLDRVKLEDAERIYQSYPHQLSGGQNQRVMIAMALISEPEVLIADEPTTALDPINQDEILSLLAELQQELKLSILFITHDLSVLTQYASRILFMKDGRIIENAATLEILNNPRTSYVKDLLKAYRLSSLQHEKNAFEKREPIFSISDLSVTYKRSSWLGKTTTHEALEKVSLQIEKGEIAALVGASGSGKTSLARALMGLLHQIEGTVHVGDRDIDYSISNDLAFLRKKVQLVFQHPDSVLDPLQTVGESVSEVIKQRHTSDFTELTRLLFEKVGLDFEMSNNYPHELSGGQKQRICIARALAVEPEILLLDEPLSALDGESRLNIIQLLRALNKEEGITILLISHDLHLVRSIAHKLFILNQGKLVEFGPLDDLFTNPKHPITQRLINVGNRPDSKIS